MDDLSRNEVSILGILLVLSSVVSIACTVAIVVTLGSVLQWW